MATVLFKYNIFIRHSISQISILIKIKFININIHFKIPENKKLIEPCDGILFIFNKYMLSI